MTDISILNLNFYCLADVMNQIKRNCEVNSRTNTLDIIKYADLISFALTHESFLNVFRENDPILYDRLQTENMYLSTSQKVVVYLDQLYSRLQKSTQKEKDSFWNIYIDALRSNTKMEEIELRYFFDIYNKDHGEILDMLMSAIQNKRSVKILQINMERCFLDRLPPLPNLKQLSLNAKINANDLVDFCQSHQSLTRLSFMNNEIYGKLTDIVPHCKSLIDLTFMIKTDLYDSEYTELAKLLNLANLRILGVHESGSLSPLIKTLAAKGPNTLKSLIIDAAPIEIADIAEVEKMQSLEEFKCRCIKLENFQLIMRRSKDDELQLTFNFENEIDASDLASLSSLTRVTSLFILGRHKPGTLKPLFMGIAANGSPKLKWLTALESLENKRTTVFNNAEILEVFKVKSLESLHCGFTIDSTMELPTHLAQMNTLKIKALTLGSIRSLFKSLTQQIPSNLNILTIIGIPLILEDILDILQIKSLEELNCEYAAMYAIYHRAQIKISSKHQLYDFSEALEKYFAVSNGNVSLFSTENCLSMDRKLSALTIRMTPEINSVGMVPLASLPNLQNLIVYGSHQHNSLTSLFQAFARREGTALQVLSVEENPISRCEVTKIAQITTLRYIKCGFLDPHSLNLLKHLPNLEALRITSEHHFIDIADEVLNLLMGCSNELTVYQHGLEITYNKYLSKLTIANHSYEDEVINGEEYAPLPKLPQLRSLHINGRHKLGSFKDFFRSLAEQNNSTLEELVLKENEKAYECSKRLENLYEDTLELTKIVSLKRLKCGFLDVTSIRLLSKLTHLRELTINRNRKVSIIQFPQQMASKDACNLQSLNLSDKTLSFNEIVARVSSLNKFERTFTDGHNIHVLAKLNQIEEFITTFDKSDSLVKLYEELFAAESKSLQALNITDRCISYDEMIIIAEIKNLKRLCCTFIDPECIKLLVQLPELSVLSLQVYQCAIEGIEILAQLNKLTDLEIISPAIGSLLGLLKQLSLREVPILQSLIIGENYVDSSEMNVIAQLKSLRRLQCGFPKEEFYECLADLTNIEVLEITSYHCFDAISQTILNILQSCHQLKVIDMHQCSQFVGLQFLDEALQILKTVRDPHVQEALQLRIPQFGGLTPEQIAISDEKYLIICRFEDIID